ncbi:MAG: (Fe-S)-binding protein [SAR202 cluster bacterium]|nr:(Fe-S)-binding protein [SAR202 cluster bacterium]MDP6714099.1 (Fe-S)-binding protein [SAR202 cluster bacterium]
MTLTDTTVKASLFVTCIIDQFFPEVGEAAVRVMQRLGVDVEFDESQTCCGQPAFNNGYWDDAKPTARRLVDSYQSAERVVIPSGSCASMVRVFYNELFHEEPDTLSSAQALAPRVSEFTEFVSDVLGAEKLEGLAHNPKPMRVTYHESCHLKRELGVDSQPRSLIRSLPGVELVEMPQAEVCCGFGGTFSVKYADISAAMLRDKIANIQSANVDAVVAGDMSCLMHIGGGLEKQDTGIRAIHIAQLLDERI